MINTDNALTKAPHQPLNLTAEEALEFAKCADPVDGPLYFMTHYFYIQHPLHGRLLYDPYPYQYDLIDSYHNYRYSVNLLGRQLGKTVTAAGYLLWYAMFNNDMTVLVAAHKYSGAQEIMFRIRYAYENCPDFIRAGVTSYNKGSIEFDNGSRIMSQTTTETTGRGLSISLLYADELAFVRPSIAREFWTSISPTLATGGRAIITSTPNNDDDQFADIWFGANKTIDEYGNETDIGVNGFKAFKATWDQHPDRDEQWKIQEIGKIGIERFEREHECKFVSFDETLINPRTLFKLTHKDPIERQGQVRWFEKPKKGHKYLVALDPSLGTGGDFAAIEVFELPGLVQVAEWKHNKTAIPEQIRIMTEINRYIIETIISNESVYYSIENNSIGEAALQSISEIGEEHIPGIFLSEPKRMRVGKYRRGFTTTNKSKLAACAKLKNWIEQEKLIINSKPLLSELKVFVAKGSSYAAKAGEHDDLVMATVLIVRMAMLLQTYDPDLQKNLKDSLDDFREPLPFIVL